MTQKELQILKFIKRLFFRFLYYRNIFVFKKYNLLMVTFQLGARPDAIVTDTILFHSEV